MSIARISGISRISYIDKYTYTYINLYILFVTVILEQPVVNYEFRSNHSAVLSLLWEIKV